MDKRLVAVVGATATGKTALAIELARRCDGEIINADSRQIYRGMDIGTAKPTVVEQALARHWLLDIAAPDDAFTLATFLDLARAALADIWARGKLPIVVGGTGQYIWALVEAWRVPRVSPDATLRAELEDRVAREGPEALADELRRIDKASAETIDARNSRRIIRAIEVTRATGRPFSEWGGKGIRDFDSAVIGLSLGRASLYARIDQRVELMLAAGLVDEVRRLNAAGYGCDLPSMASIGYREICAHLRGELTLPAATERIKTQTHRLARMQNTWFGTEDERISWMQADSADLVEQALSAVGSDAS